MRFGIAAVAMIAGVGAQAPLAYAQQVPGPANAGRLPERFAPPVAPQSVPEITLPGPEVVLPPDRAAQTHFTLTGIIVDGATVFAPLALEPLYRPLIGRDVSLLDIYRVRDAITAKYRAAGYVLSQAIIPPQTLMAGIVHIQVVEGRIGSVILDGEVRDPRGLIAAMAEKIKRSGPLRERDLERYVLLISDLPGVTVSTTLKPSTAQSGVADLIVVVKRRAITGSFQADNRGSIAIGPEENSGGVNLNSVLGLDEQTSILLATTGQTRELRYLSLRHDETLNAEGVKLSLSGSYSDAAPGGAISVLNARGFTTLASAFVTDPIIRSRSQTLSRYSPDGPPIGPS